MTLRLDGRTALITGSTSNIGKAIAVAMATAGAHVVVTGRDRLRGAAVVEAIRARGGEADFVPADLDGRRDVAHRLAAVAADAVGGRIDILVNNAGIFPGAATLETDEQAFDRVYGVNVKAAFFLTQAVVPVMATHGGGAIINLGSWVARLGVGTGGLYASTKGAIETLTRAWSAEFAGLGIRVNAISPGVVREGGHDPADPAAVMMAGTPSGTVGTPEAIGHAAVFLASDEASFVHGTVLDVDGGRTGVAVISRG
jgi:NAD(P)-dependent dehydrogenase (short-subunit alcohol dehydrogenase family)